MTRVLPAALVDTVGRFKVLILRTAPDSTALQLLAVAEATYPPKRDVLAACAHSPQERGQLRREPNLWWCGAFDGTRVPYAVAGTAVTYYLDRSAEYRRIAESASPPPAAVSRSSLVYRASIEWRDRYEDHGSKYTSVYVAQLRLSWSQYCSPICALFIHRERTVVLNAAGVILRVIGDGQQPVLVS